MDETRGRAMPERTPGPRFLTTQWGLVAAAGCQGTAESHAALSKLCEIYWYPLYAYLRGHGHSTNDAEDLTQGFFARMLEAGTLKNADPAKGRFRTFLLGALRHHLADEKERRLAIKRGGGRSLMSLDTAEAERQLTPELLQKHTPERLFMRSWGLTVLKLAMTELQQAYAQDGKEKLMLCLQAYLTGEATDGRYRQVAEELGMTEGAVKVAVHRIRRRYRETVRTQIGQTVDSAEEIDDEIRQLFDALRA